SVSLVGEGHDAGRNAIAFEVGDDFRLATFHDRDNRVGRSQVDPDNFFVLQSHEYPRVLSARVSVGLYRIGPHGGGDENCLTQLKQGLCQRGTIIRNIPKTLKTMTLNGSPISRPRRRLPKLRSSSRTLAN